MKLADVQTYASDRIKAAVALAAFGDPILYSHFTADETARAAIDTALREKGVCIEIGSVEADGDNSTPNNRGNRVEAAFEVYVAESPVVAHAPQEMALVTAVAEAVQARVDSYTQNPRCVSYSASKSEHGYVLHVLSFKVPAIL